MADLIRILDLTHEEQNALDVLVAQWRAKRTRNNLRSGFYDMKNSERSLMGESIQPSVTLRGHIDRLWPERPMVERRRPGTLTGSRVPRTWEAQVSSSRRAAAKRDS